MLFIISMISWERTENIVDFHEKWAEFMRPFQKIFFFFLSRTVFIFGCTFSQTGQEVALPIFFKNFLNKPQDIRHLNIVVSKHVA